MKTFSMVKLFTTFCLSALILLAANIADVHAQAPEASFVITGSTGTDQVYTVGQSVSTTFSALIDDLKAGGAQLRITHNGLTNASHVSGDTVTLPSSGFALGTVTVTGTIIAEEGAYIQAYWIDKEITGRADFNAAPERSNVLIVVNGPNPKAPLSVGSTFTQEITIENNDPDWPTNPVTAWQMDIVFNPLILEVTDVTEGNFLEDSQSIDEAIFFPQIKQNSEDPESVDAASVAELTRINLKGRINASQARYDTESGVELIRQQSKTLLTIEFKVLANAEEALGIHNVLILSNSDTDEDGRTPDRISYAIMIRDVFVATEDYTYVKEDVNQDEMVDILDLMIVASSIGTHNLRADINGDDVVNVLDLIAIYTSTRWGQTAPKTLVSNRSSNNPPPLALAPSANRNVDTVTIQSWIDQAKFEDNGSEVFKRGISNLETLLNSKVPSRTRLLLNYPNPFNPETWIPYQLAEATDVTVTIYSINGNPIRTLKLGHQSAGTYMSKSQAAYWDGHNEIGEQAASGVYFYTFTAGNFSATGKMLIRK